MYAAHQNLFSGVPIYLTPCLTSLIWVCPICPSILRPIILHKLAIHKLDYYYGLYRDNVIRHMKDWKDHIVKYISLKTISLFLFIFPWGCSLVWNRWLRYGPKDGLVPKTCPLLMAAKSTDTYRQVSNIRRTKSQHLKESRTTLRLSLPNPLKSDAKSRMKM